MTLEGLREEVQAADLVMVGIGEEILGVTAGFYSVLARLLDGKDYFIVTLQDREALFAAGLPSERITAPLTEREPQKGWERYLRWLSFTLNQKLCVLELGVGFQRPEIIRFPFEKVAYINQKSRYFRINGRFPQLPAQIADRGTAIKEDPVSFFREA